MATYTVNPGDSLSKIARDVLGDISRWPELASLNNLSAPYVIYPGQQLELPGSASSTALVPGSATFTPDPPWWQNPKLWIGLALFAGALMLANPPRRRR